ncbi:MAG: DNA-protecting protein DprA [Clostridia bacterium]|nr:DNA-protecting protein DprA [Clostridia bacterium]
MINNLFKVVLDSHTSLDYKHKRDIINATLNKSTLNEMVDIAVNYLTNNVKNYKIDLFRESFSNNNYQSILKSYKLKGITVITETDALYPNELKNTPFAPICLYAKGNLNLLASKNKFSIVGSRKTPPQILKLTESISNKLASAGVTIVTGIAVGGDLSAIKGAIETKNVISVLAGGFDFCLSEYNSDYIEKLFKNGLVITEHPPCVKAMPYSYPIRNRIIAGLSMGTLIVSGSHKSGARHTANYALEYGRDVFAFPYLPCTSQGELCNKLIKDGAYLVETASDIAEVCGFDIEKSASLQLSGTEKTVFEVISKGSVSVDAIAEETGLKVFELMPVLTLLEIKGVIVKDGNGEYVATQN